MSRIKYKKVVVPYGEPMVDTSSLKDLTEEQLKKFKLITTSTVFKDQDGKPAISFFSQVIEHKTADDTKNAAVSLLSNVTPAQHGTSLHTGEWRKSWPTIFKTKDTVNAKFYYEKTGRTPFWENTATKAIVSKVDNYFSRTAGEQLCGEYQQVKAEQLYGKTYLLCVINVGAVGPHYDEKDAAEGLCCVVPLGEFDGGDLVFRVQKLRFRVRTGDIIFFRSKELLHENLPYSGERYSLVFTTDHDSFTEFGQPDREYKHWIQPPLGARLKLEAEGKKPEDIVELRKKKIVTVGKVYLHLSRANTPRTKFGTMKPPTQDGNPRAPISARKNKQKEKKRKRIVIHEQSEDERSEDEPSEDERSEDEPSKDKPSEDEQSEDEQSEEVQLITKRRKTK